MMNTSTPEITPAVAYAMAKVRVLTWARVLADSDPDYDFAFTAAEDAAFLALVTSGGDDLDDRDAYNVWAQLRTEAGEDVPGYFALSWAQDELMIVIRRTINLARRIVADPDGYFSGAALLQTCLEQATVFPERHDQGSWFTLKLQRDGDGNVTSCGSTGCLAGHAMLLATDFAPRIEVDSTWGLNLAEYRVDFAQDDYGRTIDPDTAARKVLFFDDSESAYLFEPWRTLDELWVLAEVLFPGLVAHPSAERIAEIEAAGPLLAITKVGLSDNGIVATEQLATERPELFPSTDEDEG